MTTHHTIQRKYIINLCLSCQTYATPPLAKNQICTKNIYTI